ncbi:glycosyltransferase [Flavobacterium qiangtangense]|uniref:Glycosyltransferase n=1 Tax=Flavobacterium qiangtangense TaxID=1442595 RepID=A0ABW1PSF8_9FLAO
MPKEILYYKDTQILTLDGVLIPVVDQTSSDVPLVCVDLITYNQEAHVAQAIESILMQQTDFKFVLVIGEDCSTDSTRSIVKSYQQKHPENIILKLPEKNLGMLYNETTNIALCQAKYIAWCEGDDYWSDPLKLQKQVDFLESNPDYILSFHAMKVLEPSGKLVPDYITIVPENHETVIDLARHGNYIHTPSAMFRNIIKDFPFEYYECCVADYFTYMMLAQHGKLKKLDDVMAVYRVGIGTFSGEIRTKRSRYNVNLYTALLSYLTDETQKKLIYNHYKSAVEKLEKSIHKDYTTVFVSSNPFFLTVKYIQNYYHEPQKIINKIRSKLFKAKKKT